MDIGHGFDAQTDWKLSIDIPSTTISWDEKSILQKSEWKKRSLYMRINARMRRREIVSANLIQAGMEDRSKTNLQVGVI